MSDILKFILENHTSLQLGDYAILFIFMLLAGASIFIVIQKIYSVRHKAQEDLIKLKDQTVHALNAHINATNIERERLHEDLDNKIKELEDLKNNSNSTDTQIQELREEAIILSARETLAMLHRVSIAYEALFYVSVKTKEIPSPDVIKLVITYEQHVHAIIDMFNGQLKGNDLDSCLKLLQSEHIQDLSKMVYASTKSLATAAKE